MRTAQRKPRYHSDPLPSRLDSESPPPPGVVVSPEPSSNNHLSQKPGPAVFPLTPISAGDEGPISPRRMIDRYPPSYHREGHQTRPPKETDKMSQQIHHPSQDSFPDAPSHFAASTGNANGSSSSTSTVMPHRIDTLLTKPRHFRDDHSDHYYSGRPSPTHINPHTHSPTLSSDHSSIHSPAPTALPSIHHTSHGLPHHSYAPPPLKYSSHASQGHYSPHFYGQDTVSPPDVFSSPAHYQPQHNTGYNVHPQSQQQMHRSPNTMVPSNYTQPFHHITEMASPIFTNDAATKLSDRVRRRCFNCCTTDTSTWRRSSIHPGKVLCNKCGLYERTHSRPRPEQFPHKRGPLSTPTFKSKSPPTLPAPHIQERSLPHLSALSNPHSHSQSHSNSQHHQQQQQQQSLPPHATHPSLATTYSHPNTLPQIQEWLRGPGRDQPSYPLPSTVMHSLSNSVPRSPPRSPVGKPGLTASGPAARTLTPSPSPPRSPSPAYNYHASRT